MNYIELPFVKMSTDAVKPTRATEGSVGLDFYSPANYLIPPHSQLLLPTEIKLRVLLRYYGRLASKSGLAILHQLHVGAVIIDPDYTTEIMVLLIDTASRLHPIIQGDLIVQLIFKKKVSIPILKEVKELPPTARGARGYGFAIYIYVYTHSYYNIFTKYIKRHLTM